MQNRLSGNNPDELHLERYRRKTISKRLLLGENRSEVLNENKSIRLRKMKDYTYQSYYVHIHI